MHPRWHVGKRLILVVFVAVLVACSGSPELGTGGHQKAIDGSTAPSTSPPDGSRGILKNVDCLALSNLTSAPRRLRHRNAELPEAVRTVRTHGGVLVYDVTIGASGDISDVRLAKPVDPMEPWPALAQAWRSAILDWEYEPTTVQGKPVAVCMTVTVTIDVT